MSELDENALDAINTRIEITSGMEPITVPLSRDEKAEVVQAYLSALRANAPGQAEALLDWVGYMEDTSRDTRTKELCSEAAATIEALSAGDEWLDIEGAPMDGTKVDLFYPLPLGRQLDCYWDLGAWCQSVPTRGSDKHLLLEEEWDRRAFVNAEPIYFMLPPAPPKDKADD